MRENNRLDSERDQIKMESEKIELEVRAWFIWPILKLAVEETRYKAVHFLTDRSEEERFFYRID